MDILDQIGTVFADFANPKKRVFVGYLALAVLLAVGGGYLIYFAWTTKPDGYTWPDVPNAFIDVIARVLT